MITPLLFLLLLLVNNLQTMNPRHLPVDAEMTHIQRSSSLAQSNKKMMKINADNDLEKRPILVYRTF